MIAKILKSSALFKAVKYNTGKVDQQKGELLKVSGFGPLQGLSKVRPEDYINYLKMVSAQNTHIKKPQFHAAISAKGRSASKQELLELATGWMNKMGYGDQPYLVIFHKDTDNNHVHIVSTRVGMDGKKISSNFERIRSRKVINELMALDEKQQAAAELKTALAYHLQTKAQFKLLLEQKGYVLIEKGALVCMVKGGMEVLSFQMKLISERIASCEFDGARAKQLAAMLNKYKAKYSPVLRSGETVLASGAVSSGIDFTSDLAAHLKKKLGIDLVFYGKAGKDLPYGYTLIDHGKGRVYKGSDVLSLNELLQPLPALAVESGVGNIKVIVAAEGVAMPSDIEASSADFVDPDISISLDPQTPAFEQLKAFEAPLQISISEDIDDEAIHGRRRQRKKLRNQ